MKFIIILSRDIFRIKREYLKHPTGDESNSSSKDSDIVSSESNLYSIKSYTHRTTKYKWINKESMKTSRMAPSGE